MQGWGLERKRRKDDGKENMFQLSSSNLFFFNFPQKQSKTGDYFIVYCEFGFKHLVMMM